MLTRVTMLVVRDISRRTKLTWGSSRMGCLSISHVPGGPRVMPIYLAFTSMMCAKVAFLPDQLEQMMRFGKAAELVGPRLH